MQQQLRSEAERTINVLEAKVEEMTRATERLGEQWINRAGMAEAEWVVEAEATLRDVAGLEELVWLDAALAPRYRAVRPGRAGAGDRLPAIVSALRRLDQPGSGRPRTVVLPAGNEGEGFVATPLCYLTQCDGYLVGTFSAASVLGAVAGDLPEGIEVILRSGDRVVAAHPGAGGSTAAPEAGSEDDPVAVTEQSVK